MKYTNIITKYEKSLMKNKMSLNFEEKKLEKYNNMLILFENPNKMYYAKDKKRSSEKNIRSFKKKIHSLELLLKRTIRIHEKVSKTNIKNYNESLSIYENFRVAKYGLNKEEKKLNYFILIKEELKQLKKSIKYYSNIRNSIELVEEINKIKKEIERLDKVIIKIGIEIKENKRSLSKDTLERNKLFNKVAARKIQRDLEYEKLVYQNNKYKPFEIYHDYNKNQVKINNLTKKWNMIEPKYVKQQFNTNIYKKLYDFIYKEMGNEIEKKEGIALSVRELNTWYGTKQSLFNINMDFPKNKVISIIGPSGCGKSTFLRTLNRINDETEIFKLRGSIMLGDYDVYKLRNSLTREKMQITELRTKIGMIFQQPNPFPISIYKNVIYGPKINGEKNKAYLKDLAEESLKKAAIWDEVKNNLNALGTSLSGGQQQRLCIARAIANKPEILLMDEPTSALDPIAASKVEALILELKKTYTIIMVTHSMQQAARLSDFTAFFYQGELIEYDKTKKIFTNPKHKKTEDYIRGIFG